jgi:hypothetical protein
VRTRDRIRLKARIASSCSFVESSTAYSYFWSVSGPSSVTVEDARLASASIPEHLLLPSGTYVITVVVTARSLDGATELGSSTASTSTTVEPLAPIVAVIAGGSSRDIATNMGDFALSSEGSHDPDVPVTAWTAGLGYAWNCSVLLSMQPCFSGSFSIPLTSSQMVIPAAAIASALDTLGSTYLQITLALTASPSNGGSTRVSYATTLLRLVSVANSLSLVAPGTPVRGQRRIRLAITLPFALSARFKYIWTCYTCVSAGFTLDTASLFSSTLGPTLSLEPDAINMVGGTFGIAVSIIPLTPPTPAPLPSPWIPTSAPTPAPPTKAATKAPTSPTFAPTSPTRPPSVGSPTLSPTKSPTKAPTAPPTVAPTKSPTASPTMSPTSAPTWSPTASPLSVVATVKTSVTLLTRPTGGTCTISPSSGDTTTVFTVTCLNWVDTGGAAALPLFYQISSTVAPWAILEEYSDYSQLRTYLPVGPASKNYASTLLVEIQNRNGGIATFSSLSAVVLPGTRRPSDLDTQIKQAFARYQSSLSVSALVATAFSALSVVDDAQYRSTMTPLEPAAVVALRISLVSALVGINGFGAAPAYPRVWDYYGCAYPSVQERVLSMLAAATRFYSDLPTSSFVAAIKFISTATSALIDTSPNAVTASYVSAALSVLDRALAKYSANAEARGSGDVDSDAVACLAALDALALGFAKSSAVAPWEYPAFSFSRLAGQSADAKSDPAPLVLLVARVIPEDVGYQKIFSSADMSSMGAPVPPMEIILPSAFNVSTGPARGTLTHILSITAMNGYVFRQDAQDGLSSLAYPVRVRLLDESGNAVQVLATTSSFQSFVYVIPLTRPLKNCEIPTCQMWTGSSWSQSPCRRTAFTPSSVTCACSDVGIVSAVGSQYVAVVTGAVAGDMPRVSIESIGKRSGGIASILMAIAAILVFCFLASRLDKQIDDGGMRLVHRMAKRKHTEDGSSDWVLQENATFINEAERLRDSFLGKIWWTLRDAFSRHTILSIWFRYASSDFTSVDRALVVIISSLTALACTAVYWSDEPGRREVPYVMGCAAIGFYLSYCIMAAIFGMSSHTRLPEWTMKLMNRIVQVKFNVPPEYGTRVLTPMLESYRISDGPLSREAKFNFRRSNCMQRCFFRLKLLLLSLVKVNASANAYDSDLNQHSNVSKVGLQYIEIKSENELVLMFHTRLWADYLYPRKRVAWFLASVWYSVVAALVLVYHLRLIPADGYWLQVGSSQPPSGSSMFPMGAWDMCTYILNAVDQAATDRVLKDQVSTFDWLAATFGGVAIMCFVIEPGIRLFESMMQLLLLYYCCNTKGLDIARLDASCDGFAV